MIEYLNVLAIYAHTTEETFIQGLVVILKRMLLIEAHGLFILYYGICHQNPMSLKG